MGLAITPPALMLAEYSMGAIGHGDYLWARLFYPHSMWFWVLLSQLRLLDTIWPNLLIFGLAIVQFFVYGLAIDLGHKMSRDGVRYWILGVHVASAVAIFVLWGMSS